MHADYPAQNDAPQVQFAAMDIHQTYDAKPTAHSKSTSATYSGDDAHNVTNQFIWAPPKEQNAPGMAELNQAVTGYQQHFTVAEDVNLASKLAIAKFQEEPTEENRLALIMALAKPGGNPQKSHQNHNVNIAQIVYDKWMQSLRQCRSVDELRHVCQSLNEHPSDFHELKQNDRLAKSLEEEIKYRKEVLMNSYPVGEQSWSSNRAASFHMEEPTHRPSTGWESSAPIDRFASLKPEPSTPNHFMRNGQYPESKAYPSRNSAPAMSPKKTDKKVNRMTMEFLLQRLKTGPLEVDPKVMQCVVMEKQAKILSQHLEFVSMSAGSKRLRFNNNPTKYPIGSLRASEMNSLQDLKRIENGAHGNVSGFFSCGRTYAVQSFGDNQILALSFKYGACDLITRTPMAALALLKEITSAPEFLARAGSQEIYEGVMFGFPAKYYEVWFTGNLLYVVPSLQENKRPLFPNYTSPISDIHPTPEFMENVVASRGLQTIGCIGHDDNKCVPCQYHCFGMKSCLKGAACENCHMPHQSLKKTKSLEYNLSQEALMQHRENADWMGTVKSILQNAEKSDDAVLAGLAEYVIGVVGDSSRKGKGKGKGHKGGHKGKGKGHPVRQNYP